VKSYEHWLRRFLRFHQLRHPWEMGSEEVNTFLSHLAVKEQVSASTQNQALAELLFLSRKLLERDMLYALARTYPQAAREWAWQWVFSQQKRGQMVIGPANHTYPLTFSPQTRCTT